MSLTPLLEKLLAMLQENLKNQLDTVKNGRDTRQTGHVILTGNF